MCLAVPAKIVKINNDSSTVEVGGVKKTASLILLDDARVGDFVIIHAGFAIRLLNEQDALEILAEISPLFTDAQKMNY